MSQKPTYKELIKRVREFEKEADERKRAEEALQTSESFLSGIINQSPYPMWISDDRGTLLKLNQACRDLLKISDDEVVGKYNILMDSIVQEQGLLPLVRRVFEAGDTVRFEIKYDSSRLKYLKLTNFTFVILDVTVFPIRDAGGRITNAVIQHVNITERKRAEEALKKSEEKFLELFDRAPVGYHELDIHGRINRVNRTELEMLGYTAEDVLGRPVWELIAEGERSHQAVLAKLAGTRPPDRGLEKAYRRKDGTILPVLIEDRLLKDSQGRITGIRSTIQDITERKRAEEERKELEAQLRQAHKMEAIGTLAGGIAHEFNNVLGIILGNTELAMLDIPEWSHAKTCLQEIEKASHRARDVVKQLLSFSRKAEVKRKPLKAAPIVREALKLVRASIPAAIEIRRNIAGDTHVILADPTQLNQVLINLCTNASDAMHEDGGILDVTLRNVEPEESSGNLPAGKYVRLTVSDTGRGIPAESMDRIFDPYFTTKELGKGTGLGLAVVHGIVQGHDGTIIVESEIHKGTAFHVFFPAVDEEPSKETETHAALPGGKERVLFIDDEASIVRMAKMMLERIGYEVEARTDPVEAVELFRASPERFDLVITDTNMPKMTGDRVAREIMEIRPDAPVIICTGYSERIDEQKASGIGIRAYIMKPLGLSALANTVRKVLDGK